MQIIWQPGESVIADNEALMDLSEIGYTRVTPEFLTYYKNLAVKSSDIIIFLLMYGLQDKE